MTTVPPCVLLAFLIAVADSNAAAAPRTGEQRAGHSQPRPSAAEVLRAVQTDGAQATLETLLADPAVLNSILAEVRVGTSDWIEAAAALLPEASGSVSRSLATALGEALGANAALVLARVTDPVDLFQLCDPPDLHDERFDSLGTASAELTRRIAGVKKVVDPYLATVRGECLASLVRAADDLPRYFEPPAVFSPAAGSSQETVTVVGSFDNYQSDGEHESGYSVRLWSHGGEILGLVSYHLGLVGDAPTGLLENVLFNRATGELAFSAKLTTGLHSCPVHDAVPTRTLLSFRGHLQTIRLQGTVTVAEHLHGPVPVTSEEVVLRKDLDSSLNLMRDYDTIDAWRQDRDRALRRLGPKW